MLRKNWIVAAVFLLGAGCTQHERSNPLDPGSSSYAGPPIRVQVDSTGVIPDSVLADTLFPPRDTVVVLDTVYKSVSVDHNGNLIYSNPEITERTIVRKGTTYVWEPAVGVSADSSLRMWCIASDYVSVREIQWDFESDGNVDRVAAQDDTLAHAYSSADTFLVRSTLVSASGETASDSIHVIVR